MIIVQIKGGLGNQLFSLASAYGIAKENNTNVIIDKYIYDTSYKLREYMLKNFPGISNELLIGYNPKNNTISQKFYKILRKMKLRYQYKCQLINESEEFKYQEIISEKNLYLNGYWQNYMYFDKYREEIVDKFKPLIKPTDSYTQLAAEISANNSVAVHIRRGDYVHFKGGKCLEITYYFEAMNVIRNQDSKSTFYIFADDLNYCKEAFDSIENVVIISERGNFSDLEEFDLMIKCNNFIIGNSTFSWWAAYLSKNKNKVVIAPVVDMWKKEFYLPEWRTIDASLE
ncbi:alpha-1,2-fucosyltransferase [Paenibacillus sp. MMO-177]|uniref:alpha-1,2-fucosyltransferase n=1 Tax=Paenibacillus sp. MMO-177 TaxID=3081289 RepID=UPI00301671D1